MRPEFETVLRDIAQTGQTTEERLDSVILELDYRNYLSPSDRDDFERKLVNFHYGLVFGSRAKDRPLTDENFLSHSISASRTLEKAPEVSHRLNVIKKLYDELYARGGMRSILRIIEDQIRRERIQLHTGTVIYEYLRNISFEQKQKDAASYAERYPMALIGEIYQKDLAFYIHLYFEEILKNHYNLIKGIKGISL